MKDKVDRKKDHIEMAFESTVEKGQLDDRFYYEPFLAGHPIGSVPGKFAFLGKKMRFPVWVSSMTGGTKWAKTINHNLARVCNEFGLGMGLGSCRPILDGSQHFEDFNVRDIIGEEQPLYANIGIAQLQELQEEGASDRLWILCHDLRTDGLIIHVNPLQEWLQPEGDRYHIPPIESIAEFVDETNLSVIVKEVGHGFGPESMKALLKLPLAAIDFGANGGTNFSKLEMMRSDPQKREIYRPLSYVGHSAEDMLLMFNKIVDEVGGERRCDNVIISGGIQNFLDGYYLVENSIVPAVYGQAASFLKNAREDYEQLKQFVKQQTEGYQLARQFLSIRKKLWEEKL